ncbi:MAG: zinc-dependent metalloprotease, partial [Acidobacteria bacterium]|nr:zinc-dependent metalloprotease [Acidobacteriota bacterium]
TSSMVAGQDYVYAIRGDDRIPTKWEAAVNQRKAIVALTSTLRPSELVVPAKLLNMIPPRPPGFGMHRELFPRSTGEGFDPIIPGTIAADVTIGFLLQLDRAARMVSQHAVDPTLPGLEEVIDALIKATFDAPTANSYEAAVRRATERVLVTRLQWLAQGSSSSDVRAIASLRLQRLATRMRVSAGANDADLAARTLLAADIKRFLERGYEMAQLTGAAAAPAPPGAPIGDLGQSWLSAPAHCAFDDNAPWLWFYFGGSDR